MLAMSIGATAQAHVDVGITGVGAPVAAVRPTTRMSAARTSAKPIGGFAPGFGGGVSVIARRRLRDRSRRSRRRRSSSNSGAGSSPAAAFAFRNRPMFGHDAAARFAAERPDRLRPIGGTDADVFLAGLSTLLDSRDHQRRTSDPRRRRAGAAVSPIPAGVGCAAYRSTPRVSIDVRARRYDLRPSAAKQKSAIGASARMIFRVLGGVRVRLN